MIQVPLRLENLKQLDYGILAEAFAHEIEHVVKDCEDRPLDENKRTVTLKVELTPSVDKNSSTPVLSDVLVACDVSSTVPKRKSKVYKMKAKHDGQLVFNPEVPEDPEAERLYDEDNLKRERDAAVRAQENARKSAVIQQ